MNPSRCPNCGAALAHYAGAGESGVLCPECDRDAAEARPPLDLNAQLAELGREAARDAWVEAAGELERCPRTPSPIPWAHEAFLRELLDENRAFTEPEGRVFAHAYRNELHVLAAGGAR